MSGQDGLAEILKQSRIVAVLVIDALEEAVPLAEALVAGGVKLIEITLRSRSAPAAIEAIASNVKGAIVGAGTVLTAAQFAEAEKRGCRFAVSPGATPELLAAAAKSALPWLPAAATVTEMMRLREEGYLLQKFFPAEASGGTALLKSVASPFPDLRFCPTGGIDEGNAPKYLALPNVLCVGGSWVAPAPLLKSRDWKAVRDYAQKASAARH